MNGIEKITQQIEADVQAEIDVLTAQAQAQAAQTAADYDRQAAEEAEAILAQGRAAAEQRAERLENMAALEGRKRTLAVKQEMVSAAFDRALEKLTGLPEEEYAALLADLAARAARTGREEVILSPADRDRVGKQVVSKANEILARQVSPKLPDEVTETRAGAILDKVATVASALLAGTGMLTLADETRPMAGGVVLRDGQVEANCSFEVLLRLQREELAGEVAGVLFA